MPEPARPRPRLKLRSADPNFGKYDRNKRPCVSFPTTFGERAQRAGPARQEHAPAHSPVVTIVAADAPSCDDYGGDGGFDGPFEDPVEATPGGPALQIPLSQRISSKMQRRRRDQRRRNDEDARIWATVEPEFIYASICDARNGPQHCAGRVAEAACRWEQNLAAASVHCPFCCSEGTLQIINCAYEVTFVSVLAQCEVTLPSYQCSSCDKQPQLCPVSFLCMPATLSKPRVFYDEQLLQLAHQHLSHGPVAVSTWTKAQAAVHAQNGCSGKPAIWRSFGQTLRRYGKLQLALQRGQSLGIRDIAPGVHLCSDNAALCHDARGMRAAHIECSRPALCASCANRGQRC